MRWLRWARSVARLAWADWRGDAGAYAAELARIYDREFLRRVEDGLRR